MPERSTSKPKRPLPKRRLDRRKIELVSGGRVSIVVLGGRREQQGKVRWSLRR